ncbi:hypothetical protein GCM10022222_34100 [Amycolatopsis ultiminotia]|uniref:Glycosyl transferase family 2 n=1 Tax=Amycolatopsis ultiminotia TaxID=543629 RepID=A0ABP6WAR7_9PSEU
MISAVGVVVPARDEAASVSRCLHAIRRSLLRLPVSVERTVVVVADRCTDGTAARAWPLAEVVVTDSPHTIGEVRDHGCHTALTQLADHPTAHVLLLNTDADTEVDSHWAARHLGSARLGFHAATGPAHLVGEFPGGTDAAAQYRELVDHAPVNVYGANLAVRADAYTAVGRFGRTATGEDHSLWQRLETAGYRLTQDPNAFVHTSARLDGRAPEGLSSLLRRLAAAD